jgi:hypothetical protein
MLGRCAEVLSLFVSFWVSGLVVVTLCGFKFFGTWGDELR